MGKTFYACLMVGAVFAGHGTLLGVEAETPPSLGGFYYGVGIGGSFLDNELSTVWGIKFNASANRVMGSIVLGAGYVFNNTHYVGAEVMLDMSKEGSSVLARYPGGEIIVKNRGIVPGIAARFGYVYGGTMFYGKIGCAFEKTVKEVWAGGNCLGRDSTSKVVPTLGLGMEKAFSDKLSMRFEGEYVFPQKEDVGEIGCAKLAQGWKVRLMCILR